MWSCVNVAVAPPSEHPCSSSVLKACEVNGAIIGTVSMVLWSDASRSDRCS